MLQDVITHQVTELGENTQEWKQSIHIQTSKTCSNTQTGSHTLGKSFPLQELIYLCKNNNPGPLTLHAKADLIISWPHLQFITF